jgi:hypothetical protein
MQCRNKKTNTWIMKWMKIHFTMQRPTVHATAALAHLPISDLSFHCQNLYILGEDIPSPPYLLHPRRLSRVVHASSSPSDAPISTTHASPLATKQSSACFFLTSDAPISTTPASPPVTKQSSVHFFLTLDAPDVDRLFHGR